MRGEEGETSAAREASFSELVARLWRRKGTVLVSVAIALVLSGVWVVTRKPTYRASATLLLESERPGGLLGNLAAIASLTSAPTASSETSVLTSRTLAARVVAPPAAGLPARPGLLGYEHSVGLELLVRDEALTTLGYIREKLNASHPELPPTLPARRLFASARPRAGSSEPAPTRLRLEFSSADRVRVTTAGLLPDLGLASRHPAEFTFAPGETLTYRGLELRIEVEGDPRGGSFLVQRVPAYRAVDDLLERLAVREVERNSGVLSISVTDTDPWRAAETVDALCSDYLEDLARRKESRAGDTVAYVRGLIDEERAAFAKAQQDLLRVQNEHPEALAFDAAAQALLEQLAAVKARAFQVELRRRMLGEVVAALEAGDATALSRLDSAITGGLIVDPLTEGLLAEIATLLASRSVAEGRFEPAAAPVVELGESIAALEADVRARLRDRLTGIEAEAALLAREASGLEARFGELPVAASLVAEPLLAITVHKAVLPELLASLQAAEIARQSAHFSAQILDRARPPSRLATPKITLNLALGLVLGLLGGFLLVLWTEPRVGRLVDALALESETGLTVLARIPRFPAAGRAGVHPVHDAPTSPPAEPFRLLAGALRLDGARKVVAVSAVRAGEGASTVALGLALALAQEGRRVLLVDADLRSSGTGPDKRLKLAEAPGLAEGLGAGLALEETRQVFGDSTLALLARGAAPGNPGALLASPALAALLVRARTENDVVVIDLPALTSGADAQNVARQADALLLVHRAGRVRRGALAETCLDLRRGHLWPVGAVWVD